MSPELVEILNGILRVAERLVTKLIKTGAERLLIEEARGLMIG